MKDRKYNVVFIAKGDGTCYAPEAFNPETLVVYFEGVRQLPHDDYIIKNNMTIEPKWGYETKDVVFGDYDPA